MNEEKPGEPKVDGRPFDNAVGPTVQTLDGVMGGRSPLSAKQIRGDNDTPSWKAPREKAERWSTALLITIVVVAAAALLVLLRVAGII